MEHIEIGRNRKMFKRNSLGNGKLLFLKQILFHFFHEAVFATFGWVSYVIYSGSIFTIYEDNKYYDHS